MGEKGSTGLVMHIQANELSHLCHQGPFLLTWISNYIHCNVWGEITYPFPNFNGSTVEVWEWMSNFIPRHVITYLC